MAHSYEDKLRALHRSFGAWRDLPCDGETYVEQMRRGLRRRLRRLRAPKTPKAPC